MGERGIRIAIIENGHFDRDAEDSIKSRRVAALFKSCFDEQYKKLLLFSSKRIYNKATTNRKFTEVIL